MNTPEVIRERLGILVRNVWVAFKRRELAGGKPVPPSHIAPWEQLSEEDKEVDRQIGEAVFFGGASFIGGRGGFPEICSKCGSHSKYHCNGVCPPEVAF